MLLQDATENLEVFSWMQQGYGGGSEGKKGSMSVRGKIKGKTVKVSSGGTGKNRKVKGTTISRKKSKALAQAPATAASNAEWAGKAGKRSGTGTRKGALKAAKAPGAAASVRASDDMW